MEEEISTGVYMLRMIPRKSLKNKFPKMRFWRFTFSALIRIAMGYIFLSNMFVVVVQATGVIGELSLYASAVPACIPAGQDASFFALYCVSLPFQIFFTMYWRCKLV